VVEGKRRGEEQWERVTFTKDQARQARIQLGDYPEDKLVARATSRLCRRKFADCVVGMPYTVEELEDLDTAGSISDGGQNGVPAGAETAPSAPPKTAQRRTRKAAQPAVAPAETPTSTAATATPTGPPLPGEDGYDDDPPLPEPATREQLNALHAILTEQGVKDRVEKLDIVRRIVGRDLGSSAEMTYEEAHATLDTLQHAASHPAGFTGFLSELLAATAEAAAPPADGDG
jgi:pyruvate/2-oxoglutarate dehydrogenase complex dihydrolipoamide acyltransferase (E2) component